MKKKVAILCSLLCCTLMVPHFSASAEAAIVLGSFSHKPVNAAASEPFSQEGKKQAGSVAMCDKWSGVYLVRGNVDATYGYRLELYGEGLDDREAVLEARLSFLEGDKALKYLIGLQDDPDNPSAPLSLVFTPARVSRPGNASFRLELVSENYYADGVIHAVTIDANDVQVELPVSEIFSPLDQEVNINSVMHRDGRCYVRTEPEVRYECSLKTPEGERNLDNDEMMLRNGKVFTLRKTGDYPMILEAMIGEGKIVEFPVTIHASKEFEQAAIDGLAPVSTANHLRSEGFLQAQNIGSSLPEATVSSEKQFTGTEKNNAACPALESFRKSWLYVPGTIPASCQLSDNRAQLQLFPEDKIQGSGVVPDTYAVEFLSGDPFLENAIRFSEVGNCLFLFVDNSVLQQPGEAVFRIMLKAGELYDEKEYTLRVLSWEEHPLFEVINPEMVVKVPVKFLIPEGILAECFATSHAEEIAAGIPDFFGDASIFNSCIRLDKEPGETLKNDYLHFSEDGSREFVFSEEGDYRFELMVTFGNVYYRQNVIISALSDDNAE